MDVNLEVDDKRAAFIKAVNAEFVLAVGKYGGPRQYLLAQLPDHSSQNAFAHWLWTEFPERDDIFYNHNQTFETLATEAEMATSSPLIFHVAALGYLTKCSHKPPPGMQKFGLLLEQYLLDGFVTSTEPLLLSQPPSLQALGLVQLWGSPGEPVLPTASLGYMQGQARTATLLALLKWCHCDGWVLEEVHPILHKTVLQVYAHKIHCASQLDEALMNMKLSVRGSIRTQNNIIQTVIMIRNLNMLGAADVTTFVRKWNAQSARSTQIIGKKAASIKLLFEVSACSDPGPNTTGGILELILAHVEAM